MKKNSARYIQNRYCKIIDEANEAFVIAKDIVEENAQLKELLKELFETADLAYCEDELLTKISEVLK